MVNAARTPAHHKHQHQPEHEGGGRQPHLMARAWNRVRMMPGPASPYKIGDAVVGDDPFNGRHEGVVVSRAPGSVGVGTAEGVVYYDPRQVRRQE
jgi:hypothetical protein